jgi:hypothetical protein
MAALRQNDFMANDTVKQTLRFTAQEYRVILRRLRRDDPRGESFQAWAHALLIEAARAEMTKLNQPQRAAGGQQQ